MPLKEILDHQFRANPAYELVSYDRLTQGDQTYLEKLAGDAGFYGVMVNGAESKAVDPETALLVMTLQEPGFIPTYVRHRFRGTINQAIAELVLDEILQIVAGEEFLSGAAAHPLIYDPVLERQASAHRLSQLSCSALRYGQELPPMTPDLLAQRLYIYNTIPLSTEWQEALPTSAAIENWLGINGWMGKIWQRIDDRKQLGWISWRHRRGGKGTLPYKLYISPHPDYLPDVFRFIVEILGQHRVPSFKIGKDVYGILRSDKMVAYLPNFDDLFALVQTLQKELESCPVQGVPFTAPIDKAGLLSWGMDPPDSAQLFAGEGRESWRFWITQQLASALNSAKAGDSAIEPWQFALDRLQLEGIDTERWIPQQTIWKKNETAR